MKKKKSNKDRNAKKRHNKKRSSQPVKKCPYETTLRKYDSNFMADTAVHVSGYKSYRPAPGHIPTPNNKSSVAVFKEACYQLYTGSTMEYMEPHLMQLYKRNPQAMMHTNTIKDKYTRERYLGYTLFSEYVCSLDINSELYRRVSNSAMCLKYNEMINDRQRKVRCIGDEVLEVIMDLRIDVDVDISELQGRWTFLPERKSTKSVLDIGLLNYQSMISVISPSLYDPSASDTYMVGCGGNIGVMPISNSNFIDETLERLNDPMVVEFSKPMLQTGPEVMTNAITYTQFLVTYTLALKAGLITEVELPGSDNVVVAKPNPTHSRVFAAKRTGYEVGLHYVPPFLRELRDSRFAKEADGSNKIVVVCGHWRGSSKTADVKLVTDKVS